MRAVPHFSGSLIVSDPPTRIRDHLFLLEDQRYLLILEYRLSAAASLAGPLVDR
jgi:hypothetical protein